MFRNSILASSLLNGLVVASVLATEDCSLIVQKKLPAPTMNKHRKTRLFNALEAQTDEELSWQGTSEMITTMVNGAHRVQLHRPQGMTYEEVKELEAKLRMHVEKVLKYKAQQKASKPINSARLRRTAERVR